MSSIPTIDGAQLEVRLWKPDQPKGLAIIQGGTAIPQRYYGAFAQWLSERGWAVATFDYRGIGGSKHGHARDSGASMSIWAERDVPTVHAWAEQQVPGVPLAIIGHSYGGQIVGLSVNPRVQSTLLIAAQSGHWRLWDGPRRYGMAALWHVGMPIIAGTLGHIPGWMGIGEDLPGGAAKEWAQWGRHPEYLFAHKPGAIEAFASYPGRVKSISISDDAYAPPRSVQAFAERFPQDRHTFQTVHPADFGLAEIGHFGWFRKSGNLLWPSAAEWLEQPL